MTTRVLVVECWREVVDKVSDWIANLSPTTKTITALIGLMVLTWTASTTYLSKKYAPLESVESLRREIEVVQGLAQTVARNTASADSLRQSVRSLDLTACLILVEIRRIDREIEDSSSGPDEHMTWRECYNGGSRAFFDPPG